MATQAARQAHNKTAIRRTVKVGFKKVFPNPNIAGMVQRAVKLATPIVQQAHLLANLHVLRMCEAGLQLPPLDITFWNRCMCAVSEATEGSADYDPAVDPALTASLAFYDTSVPINSARPQRPAFIKSVISEANKLAVTNFKNHVAVNFFSRTKLWIKLHLSNTQLPQPQAIQYFSGLPRRQLQSWSSLITRCGTNPQHTIAGLLPIYTSLAAPSPAAWTHAQALVTHLQARIPVPATSDSINANPHLYLPWMWEMLQDIEFWAAAYEPGSLLFSMVPQCGNQTRFITITSTCLHRLLHFSPQRPNSLPNLSHGNSTAFIAHQDIWWLAHTRCMAFAQRHRQHWNFGYHVSTDGVSVSIGFELEAPVPGQPLHPYRLAQLAPSGQPQPVQGVLGPFLHNLQSAPRIVGIDPGRINIYTAVVHTPQAAQTLQQPSPVKYQTLKCTAASFKEQSGANARTAKVAKWLKTDRPVSQAIKGMPSAHTSSSQAFSHHCSYRLQHSHLIASHFTSRRYKTLRWETYNRKQRALAMLCSSVTAGNKDTVVAFGNAGFAHNSRGRPSSLTKGFKRQLAGRCRLFEVDEHNTSAKCCACYQPMPGMGLGTDPNNRGRRDRGPRSYDVRLCTNTVCHRSLWHRDVNAAINMLRLFLIWAAGQARPPEF
ncbi:hypothetical protein ABBQ32_009394 [Trebouxia sp. C0010 RCD-2024]